MKQNLVKTCQNMAIQVKFGKTWLLRLNLAKYGYLGLNWQKLGKHDNLG